MKRMVNFNEKMISEKLRKENPTGADGASFIKIMNSLYKRRLMILAFVLGNLWIVSTGYGYNVTISTNATTNANFWSPLTNGTYTFTPTVDANINANDITTKLGTGNVIINTGNGQTTGNVTISTAITATNTTTTQRTFTITAAGSITVNTSSNINLYGSSANDGNPNTSRPGTNLSFVAGTTISIGSTINTSGGLRGNGSGGNAGNISLTAGLTSGITINAALTAIGGNGKNANGGNAGTISITAPGGISLSANLAATGGTGGTGFTAGAPGTITINDGAAIVTTGGTNNGQTAGIISGGNFIKQGAGTFKLAGANTFTGATTINGGILQLGNASALGTTSGITITSGTLDLNGYDASAGALAGSGTLTNSNTTTATFTTGNSNTNAFSGTISGALNLTKTGSGTLSLSGTNAYTGTTTIGDGTLSISNINNLGNAISAIALGSATTTGTLSYSGAEADFTRGFTVNAGGGGITNTSANLLTISTSGIVNDGPLTFSNTGSGGTTISSAISSNGSLIINNTGSGITTLSGANTFTGTTTINGGILQLGNASALGTTSGITITSGTFDLNGYDASAGGLAGSGTLTNSNTTTATFTTGNSNTNAFSGTISGALNLTKTGSGTLTLSGNNSYSGATAINIGTLRLGHVNALGTTIDYTTVANGASLDLNGLTIAEPVTLNGGTLTNSTGTANYSGAISLLLASSITNTGTSLTLTGEINATDINLTLGGTGTGSISGAIKTGTGTLTKTGVGTWTLSAANTYSGSTAINAGTLQLNSAAALGTSSSTTVSTGATLDLNGVTLSTSRPLTLNGGTLSNSSTATTFDGAITLANASTINTPGDITLSNEISGANSLTKIGAGKLILSGANSYSGAIAINAGILQLGNNAALGTSSGVTVESGATLELNGFSAARPLALNGGTLSNSSDISIYDGAITLGANSTIAATGIIMLGGGINGNFQLTKIGVGTLNVGTVLSEIGNLTISEGKFTIPIGGMVTVVETTTVNVNGSLTLESDNVLTGSLITNWATGIASVTRWMSPRRWHIVSSPVSGQTVGDFLSDTKNNNIPNNTVPGHTSERGMRSYNPSLNQWGDFYTNASTEVMTPGKGYAVRVKGSASFTQDVTFSGILNAGDIPVENLEPGKWNCVGNPYTSAIEINSASGSTSNFLAVNGGNLDPSYGAIYVWHQPVDEDINETAGNYQTISNATFIPTDFPTSLENKVQQGQAFMVKMASMATTLNFTFAMKSHDIGLALKSTNNIWPTIKLTAMADSITSSTIVAFNEGMTPGLDPTYDAGLLKGGASVEVYTRLVEDNGIPFDIQALPANYQSTIVPVGIDCTKGGMVTFSAELMHVPSACQALLEDRQNKVLTDLSVNSYTTDLAGSTSSQGRFFLHTSYSTTGMDAKDKIQNLRAWASHSEVMISGPVSSRAIASLYDLQGRKVATYPLQEGNLNSVPVKGLNQGVCLLRVQDNNRVQVLKIKIGQ